MHKVRQSLADLKVGTQIVYTNMAKHLRQEMRDEIISIGEKISAIDGDKITVDAFLYWDEDDDEAFNVGSKVIRYKNYKYSLLTTEACKEYVSEHGYERDTDEVWSDCEAYYGISVDASDPIQEFALAVLRKDQQAIDAVKDILKI